MDSSKLTRIGSLVLKISTLTLFAVSMTAEAGLSARERRTRPKLDPDATCQLFMILPEVEITSPPPDKESGPERIDDLTLMQGQMFEAANNGKYELANHLRRRLENQIYLQKLPNEPDAYIHSHELYKVSEVSYVIVRNEPEGAKEAAAYEIVKAFGYPINMPVTQSRSPIAAGRSFQIFHGYPNPPAKKQDSKTGKMIPQAVGFAPLGFERKREIHQEISFDSDLFIVDFLTLNPARYEENVIYERGKRPIPYDWDAGFLAGPFANFEFFDKAHSYYDIPELRPNNRQEYYDSAKAILRDKLATTKFDWKKAIENLDEDRLIEALKLRLRDNHAVHQVKGQICALRAAIYDGDLRICQRFGFNLSRATDMMRTPDYRQHDRE